MSAVAAYSVDYGLPLALLFHSSLLSAPNPRKKATRVLKYDITPVSPSPSRPSSVPPTASSVSGVSAGEDNTTEDQQVSAHSQTGDGGGVESAVSTSTGVAEPAGNVQVGGAVSGYQ